MWKAKREGCQVKVWSTAVERDPLLTYKTTPRSLQPTTQLPQDNWGFPDEPLSSKSHTRADRKERNQKPRKTRGYLEVSNFTIILTTPTRAT